VTVVFLIGVVTYYASVWGINVNFEEVSSPEYVPMYKGTFCSLSGMLALGLFIHNAIITIVSNNRYPENNVRFFSLACCRINLKS
jgi:sodium-coupled neutral amino acid transporter 9